MAQEEQNPTAGALRSVIANGTAALSSLVIAVIIAKEFGVRPLGTYFFLLVVGQSVARVFSGIGTAIRRRSRNYEDSSQYETVGVVLGAILIAIVTIVALVGRFGFSQEIASYWFTRMEFYGTLAVVGGLGSYHMLHGAFTARRDSSLVKVLRHTLLAIAVLAIAIYAPAYGVGLMLVSYGVISGLFALAMIPYTIPSIPKLKHFLGVLKTSRITVIGAFASNFHHKADVIIIGVLVGVTGVGYYEAALQVVIPMMLAASFSSNLMALNLQGTNSKYQATELVRSAISYSTVFAFPAIAVFVPLSVETLEFFFTSEFKTAWSILTLLLFTQFIAAVRTPYGLSLRALGERKKAIGVRLIALFVNVGLSIYMVLQYGVLGAVLATGTVELLTLLAYYILVKRKITQTTRLGELARQIGSAFVVSIPLFILQWLDVVDSPRYYAITATLGIIVFFILYIGLSERTRRTLYHEFF